MKKLNSAVGTTQKTIAQLLCEEKIRPLFQPEQPMQIIFLRAERKNNNRF